MRLLFLSAVLASTVAAAAVPTLAPALPLEVFEATAATPLTLEEVLHNGDNSSAPVSVPVNEFAIAATCANPRMRTEWDHLSTADRQAFVNALICLMGKPASGQFPQAKSRYEDFVALHQSLTPNVHGNHKFLIWHRYFIWAFEDVLRTECSWSGSLPWFDETRYAGRFADSTIFSNEWFGAVAIGGNCVTNGQFAGLTLNIGPGPGNQPHCLARNDNPSVTINTGPDFVNGCNAWGDYKDMAACSEGAAHASGHNGIGAVMSDMYASPGDPLFWLHHAFIDRNYRIWQNADPARITYIDGTDRFGNQLTLDTTVYINNFRPDIKIRDIINTLGDALCYRYNY